MFQSTDSRCSRAQSLFCLLNLLFGDVLIAVVMVICISSLPNEHKVNESPAQLTLLP